MENSTAEVKSLGDEAKIVSIAFKVIAIIVAILGNSLVLKAFFKFPSLRTASNSILVSLSVADILTAIPLILHISLIAYELGENPHTTNVQFLCNSSTRLSLVLISGIILHLVLISIERFIAVKFALRYHTIVTIRRAVIACLIVWLLSLALTLLFPLALTEDNSKRAYEKLFQTLHPCFKVPARPSRQNGPKMPSSTRGYFIFLMISLVIIPIVTILGSYGYVFFVARKHRKHIRDQTDIQGISIIKSELKGAYTLAIVVGGCLVSFLPLLVVTSYRFVGEPHVIQKPWLKYIVYDFALGLNACLNPLIYGLRHKELKIAFRKLLKCA